MVLSRHISTSETVEKWLLQVQDTMFLSVRDVLHRALLAYSEAPRVKWVREWPGQIALAVNQIYWTQGAHEAIRKQPGGLKEFLDTLTTQVYTYCCCCALLLTVCLYIFLKLFTHYSISGNQGF